MVSAASAVLAAGAAGCAPARKRYGLRFLIALCPWYLFSKVLAADWAIAIPSDCPSAVACTWRTQSALRRFVRRGLGIGGITYPRRYAPRQHIQLSKGAGVAQGLAPRHR